MTVLITGGAGYIGSHVVRLLRERGDEVVIVDDLVTGDRSRVPGVPLFQMDLSRSDSTEALEKIMRDHSVRAVIHFAGRKQVGESVDRPAWYYQQNVGSLAHLLIAMENTHVSELVFSSSAAVYGAPEGASVREDTLTKPINPYGETKLVGEWLVAAAVKSLGLRACSLRYFNVAGAGWPELGDTAVLNLVPMVFERIDQGLSPLIFGEDYATPDGTCIRDFIHVLDLAKAHLATLDSLSVGDPRHDIFNVGSGKGFSVREMVDAILGETGVALTPHGRERRLGDPAIVVADAQLIANTVGWVSQLDLSDIVRSAWESHQLLRKAKPRATH
ncbi:UDP-glucose 4-epimerase GalE [Cryobacterium shii]|uniref:UDP-glucose 4-epimerase n=1 Tax=Cryobacterium shii TaxID=1259235 RepID=A0AAQ2C7G2_9MICO|nr:UDP-glucose 4-epimerase GalE [Cryobacterium shii]TFC49996.1 UDP-glucose 4-epimerase GalE [Cryobacterium shii]